MLHKVLKTTLRKLYHEQLQFEWVCLYDGSPCDAFESSNSNILYLSIGLKNIGK